MAQKAKAKNQPQIPAEYKSLDPDLQSLLVNVAPGTRRARDIISKYNADKAERESANAATIRAERQKAREDALKDAPPELRARLAGIEDPEHIAAIAREFSEEQRAKDVQTGAATAGSVTTGFVAGLGGGAWAENVSKKAVADKLQKRSDNIKNVAASIRAVNHNAPNARDVYGDLSKNVNTSPRIIPAASGLVGTGLLAAGAYNTFDRAPKAQSDFERAAWYGAGVGEMTAGTKMLAGSAGRYINPPVEMPVADVAAINSARRMAEGGTLGPVAPAADADPYRPPDDPKNPPETPPKARGVVYRGTNTGAVKKIAETLGASTRGNKKAVASAALEALDASPDASAQARLLKIETKGRTAGEVKEAVRTRLIEMTNSRGRIALLLLSPTSAAAVAGATVYGMTDAQAGETAGDARGRAAGNAAVAGATAGASAWGIGKGIEKVAQYAPGVGRAAGRVIPPLAIGLTAYDAANAASSAYGRAQEVETSRPEWGYRDPSTGDWAKPPRGYQGPLEMRTFENARPPLPLPERRSLPDAGADPMQFPPQVEGEIDQMMQNGASEADIAQYLKQMIEGAGLQPPAPPQPPARQGGIGGPNNRETIAALF